MLRIEIEENLLVIDDAYFYEYVKKIKFLYITIYKYSVTTPKKSSVSALLAGTEEVEEPISNKNQIGYRSYKTESSLLSVEDTDN